MKKIIILSAAIFYSFNLQSTATTTLNNHEPLSSFATVSMPIALVNDPFTKAIFATIDATFGSGKTGIGLDTYQITHLKKTYLYLIFLTKLEKVTTDPKFKQYQPAFAPFLQDNKTSMPHIPTDAFVTSNAWSGVTITAQDLQNSTAWQLYVRSMICDIYVYFSMVLQIIHNVEKQTFNYIPHFETSFYNADYTDFRTLNEMARTRLVLEDTLKRRWVQQSPDWQQLPSITTTMPKGGNQETVESAVVKFRKTQFYQTIHSLHAALGTNADQQVTSISNEQLLSAPSLASPLKEQVWCYYMLYEASGQLTSFLHAQNLQQVLQIYNSSPLTPNIFPYKPEDYVLLDELLAVKSKAEGTNTNSIFPSPSQYKAEEIRKPEHLQQTYRNYLREVEQNLAAMNNSQVQAQMWSFFSDLAHDISKAFDDIKNGIEAAWNAVKDFTISAGEGIAGLAAKAVGFFAELGGDDKISNWADSEMKRAHQTFVTASTDLANCVTDFGKSLEDGWIAPYAELNGDLVGFITDDKKIGEDISTVVNSVADTIVNVAASVETAQLQEEAGSTQNLYNVAKVSTQLAVVVGDAAWAIFSSKGREEFLQQGQQLGKDCLDAITQSYSCIMKANKALMESVITGLGAIVNSITTIFIDISREVTYLFTGGIFKVLGLANIPGFKQAAAYAAQTRDHVTDVLEAHRATINMVMGVVACVVADAVVDVETGGAGTVADAEIDASIMGASQAAAQATTEAAQEATQEAATLSDTAATLRTAATSAERVVQDAGEDATPAMKQAAQKAQELAEDAEQQAAQATAKAEKLSNIAQQTSTDTTESTEKNLAQKIAQKAQSTVQEAIKNVRDLSKSAENILKSNAKIAEDAANDAKTAQTAAQDAQADFTEAQTEMQEAQENLKEALSSGDDSEIAQARNAVDESSKNLQEAGTKLKEANQNLTQAQQAEQVATKIAEETKLGKVARYGKNALKTLGKVLKPVGFLMNVTFNLGSIIGDYNQDEKNATQEMQQTQALDALWSFNNANKISQAQQQLAFLEEIEQKAQAAVGNQALGLTLSQNLVNANLLTLRTSIAQALAPFYAQQLIPNAITMLPWANIGASWKLLTNYIDLYPSQGFFTTTTGRPDFPFAQEIAQAPAITKQFLAKGIEKFWFNQRCTARDTYTAQGTLKKPTDPLTVRVNLQFLYTLNSDFYVGLYLGGNYHDYNSIKFVTEKLQGITLQQAQQNPALLTQDNVNADIVDLDEAHLAKMVVVYRDNESASLKLGIYEHDGLNWIAQQPIPEIAQFDQPHTYTLQTTLNGTELMVELFVDGIITPVITKTVAVTAISNQRTYGIICSGAAIEWNQIEPKPVINTKQRAEINTMMTEKIREQQIKLKLAQASNPIFGNFKLKPLSKQALLLGQYVYATTDTDLKKLLTGPNETAIDFVIFGNNIPGTAPSFGLDPKTALSKTNPVLISVINGTMYDMQGNSVGAVTDIWNQYQTNFGPFSPKLNDFIVQQQTALNTALSHINFGSFALDIINQDALQSGRYIYTCMQTLKDAQNKPTIDYLVCADATAKNLTIGMPPTANNATALFSFVSGNLYAKNTILTTAAPTPMSTNSNPSLAFGTYASQFNLSQTGTIYTTINNAYANYVPPTTSKGPTPAVKTTTHTIAQPVHFKGVHLLFHEQTIGSSAHAPGVHLDFGKNSFEQRQKAASGNKVGYQFYTIKSKK